MVGLEPQVPGALTDLLHRRGQPLLAEVVGFYQGEAIAIALGDLRGVGQDDIHPKSGHQRNQALWN